MEAVSDINSFCDFRKDNLNLDSSDKLFVDRLRDIQTDLFKSYSLDNDSLHSIQTQEFYAKILKADEYVLEVLRDGFYPVFKDGILPASNELPNNASARRQIEFVEVEIDKLLKNDYIRKVDIKPTIVSPLSVSERFSVSEQKVKFRLCLDLSRSLNNLIESKVAIPDGLNILRYEIEENDYFVNADFKSAYHLVRMHKDFHTYLGSSIYF